MDLAGAAKSGSPTFDKVIRRIRRIEFGGLAAWLLGFGLVVYLSLKGGGFDPIVRGQLGIAIWWIVLAGVLVGALPLRRPGSLSLSGLVLFCAFVAWTALSLLWTESAERTAAELSRVVTYLGIFGLALFVRAPKSARHMVGAVGSAIAIVSLIALTSRLHPAWIPDATETARILTGTQNRLSYPVNFWNGLAELIAIGLPLVLYVATSARTLLARSLAAGVLPAMALTIFFTFSRTGAAAAIVGLLAFLALTNDRVPKLIALLLTGVGSAVLIGAATRRDALEDGLIGHTSSVQGNELLVLTIAICVAVALVHAGISWLLTERTRPRWLSPTKRDAQWGLIAIFAVLLLTSVAVSVPDRVSKAWSEFKIPESSGIGVSRFGGFEGNGRYQYWSAAIDENASDPLKGTGSGTFEYWWARNGDIPGFVRDSHSLYLQTLGELGIFGFVLLGSFLTLVIAGGLYQLANAAERKRGQLAACLGGCVAFCIAAGFDWVWQIPVIPIAFLLLGATILSASGGRRSQGLPWASRVIVAALGLAALVAIAVPLASVTLVRQSQLDAASGNLNAAENKAVTAQEVQPSAASPHLQEALVAELQGDLSKAETAARTATSKEPTNWRTWLVLSRIQAERNQVNESISAYRQARSLNPRSPLFSK